MKLLKNFRLNVIVRIFLIVANVVALAWVITNTAWFFTPLVLFIVLLLLIANLIYYVERTNRNLSQFLLSVKQGGFTNLFKDRSHGGTHAELNEVFNEILLQFQKITLERESHYQYLQTLNENLGVSLISYDAQGNVELMNPAAKTLLKKPYLRKIEDLKSINKDLYSTIMRLESEEKRVIKTVFNDELLQLSVQVKDFKAQETQFRLVLIHNIHNELEEKEVEAWQKLISVLTHEIMNSVTPIASLSTALNQQLNDHNWQIKPEEAEDLKISLGTIENRSKGLMRFVNAYKDFTRQPDLSISEFNLSELINRLIKLLAPDLEQNNIQLENRMKSTCVIKADKELIEQVIINIIKNAIEALKDIDDPVITIVQEKAGRSVRLKISDNGPGMDKEVLDRIFVPFFTTKKKGTGIGLSFARQIMRLHNGSLTVQTNPGEGATFVLEF